MARNETKDPSNGGALFVVATPIGNLQDMSERAVEVLASADLILAEDTRVSAKLLGRFGINKPRRSFHEHNEERLCPQMVERIARGARIALVCDAGTPLINDPGYRLVARLRERGLRVIPIPGPSAVVCALSVAGVPTERFCFEGFLPAKAGARHRRLETLARESRTLAFYEAPHRILDIMSSLVEVFGAGRTAVVARELTKLHETVRRGSLGELAEWLENDSEQCKGEFVIVVAPGPAPGDGNADDHGSLLRVLLEELPLKRAVSVAVRLTGGKRNEIYRQALALTGGEDVEADEG